MNILQNKKGIHKAAFPKQSRCHESQPSAITVSN